MKSVCLFAAGVMVPYIINDMLAREVSWLLWDTTIFGLLLYGALRGRKK